jgi:hypothetical protein
MLKERQFVFDIRIGFSEEGREETCELPWLYLNLSFLGRCLVLHLIVYISKIKKSILFAILGASLTHLHTNICTLDPDPFE